MVESDKSPWQLVVAQGPHCCVVKVCHLSTTRNVLALRSLPTGHLCQRDQVYELHIVRARLVRRHHGVLAVHALPHWHALTRHGWHLGVHLPRYASCGAFTCILPILTIILPSVNHSGVGLLYRVNNDTKVHITYLLNGSVNENNQLLQHGKRKSSRLAHWPQSLNCILLSRIFVRIQHAPHVHKS
jgi:hypothetical protein